MWIEPKGNAFPCHKEPPCDSMALEGSATINGIDPLFSRVEVGKAFLNALLKL